MKKGTGKKKIDIKKITNDSSRKVTLSKRRTGLFKKAQQLEIKTGARVSLMVFSPAGGLYISGDLSLFDNNNGLLENFNIDELILLKEQLEKNRDKLVSKMGSEFVDSLFVHSDT